MEDAQGALTAGILALVILAGMALAVLRMARSDSESRLSRRERNEQQPDHRR